MAWWKKGWSTERRTLRPLLRGIKEAQCPKVRHGAFCRPGQKSKNLPEVRECWSPSPSIFLYPGPLLVVGRFPFYIMNRVSWYTCGRLARLADISVSATLKWLYTHSYINTPGAEVHVKSFSHVRTFKRTKSNFRLFVTTWNNWVHLTFV